jgi:hypothetical protein
VTRRYITTGAPITDGDEASWHREWTALGGRYRPSRCGRQQTVGQPVVEYERASDPLLGVLPQQIVWAIKGVPPFGATNGGRRSSTN